uniref:protein mono-ADP-ribosyltransferase PARP9 isoform X4 n=1 Tax=Oncorhynchus gorbuscha TaxID=8017 RepID=UPI001EAF0F3A|nr:protein mono-ADP-ribosyltransferase PARP9 isoform X4 [Oncorhynchus gorbuscha]
MANSDNFPLEEEIVSILVQCGPALTYALQSKFGCTAVLHGVDVASAGAGQSMKPEMRFSTLLSKGLRVSVWRDDLTTHCGVEAVVNAANEHLSHGGGLAKALSDAGGPDIQRASDRYIKANGKLLTGDAIIAPSGNLPYKKIIHAVGPSLPYNCKKSDVDNAIPKLRAAINNILEITIKNNLKSVAIPAISSGLFNFPLPLCANVIVQTLKRYHDHTYNGGPLEVRLVNHDDPSVREMERACHEVLVSSVSHSQPAAAQWLPPKVSYSEIVSHGKGLTSMKINNVTLNLKKGHIQRQQAFEDQLKSLQGATQYSSSFNSASAQGEIPVKSSRSVFEPTTGHFDSRDPRESTQPYIELSSAFDETLREARSWLCSVFYPVSKKVFTIRNNFIQHFGEHEIGKLLTVQTKFKVSFKVFFKDGCAGVNIHGASRDVTAAVLEVEAMCCEVQEDFAKAEETDMGLNTSTSSARKPVDESSSDYRQRQRNFSSLNIVRVEKVENRALKQVFELKKKQLDVSTSQRMYQRLPAQYCHLLTRVGFQREFAPPEEKIYGEGIYFSGSVDGAKKQWKGLADEAYLYFVEAQVLTGNSTHGSPDLIVPPVMPSGDPITLYDSVKGGVDTYVIFNGHQALPEYLIICKNE